MKFYNFCLLVLISLFAFSCSNSNQTGQKKLVIYSPHGKELLGEFEQLYEKAHPDVDVQWLDMGSQDVFDRIRTEKENPQADLWWGAPATIFMRAEKMNLLEEYNPSWADKVPASSKSNDGFWYGTYLTPSVIAFNSSVFDENTAPKDWDALVSPEWKDKVVIRNPLASGTMRVIFSAMIERSLKNTGSEEAGWEWLRKLDANTSDYAADPTQMYGKLGGNNQAVTLWNMPDIILQKEKNNYPFGYVFPQSGTVVLTDGIAIVKGTKNLELAKEFYEFVTSPENLLIQAEKYHRIPARTDLPKEKLPKWISEADYTALDLDWDLIAEREAEWMKKWDAEIKGKN